MEEAFLGASDLIERNGNVLRDAKLVIALDALLVAGSVGGAADILGVQISAMSRLLAELRNHFNDRILIRTGHGMRPSPFAEAIRMNVRRVADETRKLLEGTSEDDLSTLAPDPSWSNRTRQPAVPLSISPANTLDGTPTPFHVAQKLATIDKRSPAHRRLAKYVALIAAGPGHGRSLALDEARDAFEIMLKGEADPAQIGALLMLLQYRGATTAEIAGCVSAMQAQRPDPIDVDLDWPVYVSPHSKNSPWFLHAAKLVAAAGYRVLLHGQLGNQGGSGKLEIAATDAGIGLCWSTNEIAHQLSSRSIAYAPLGAFMPRIQSLLALYPLFEQRSPANSAINLLNPFAAKAILAGSAQTSNLDLYCDVAEQLGLPSVTIINSTRDYAQLNPQRMTRICRLIEGQRSNINLPSIGRRGRRLDVAFTQKEYWLAVWSGAVKDEVAEATITYTAAAALFALRRDAETPFFSLLVKAQQLWRERER